MNIKILLKDKKKIKKKIKRDIYNMSKFKFIYNVFHNLNCELPYFIFCLNIRF